MSAKTSNRAVTVASLAAMKRAGEKIAMLTAYDASFAAQVERAGTEIVLVGDSLGNVIQGHATTVPVTVDDIVYHTAAVARGLSRALLIADMPFLSFAYPEQAAANAARLMGEGGAHMVKLEGGGFAVDVTASLVERGVPVCAHLGLTPQWVHKLGGFSVQGRTEEAAEVMRGEAKRMAEAGAGLLVLECVPSALAGEIARDIDIPVIGIGAGGECDGQVLVLYDALGITPGRVPRFAKDFTAEAGSVPHALERFVADVKSGAFPGPEHCF